MVIIIGVAVALTIPVYIFLWFGPFTVRGEIIGRQQLVDAAWGQVQNQYQRRFDLLPKLFQVVEAHMKFEAKVQTAVAEARSAIGKAYNPDTGQPIPGAAPEDQIKAMQAIDSVVITVRSVVEATPDLRSIEAVKDLMTQLEGTENRIATERGRYVETVRDYNTYMLTPWPGAYFNEFYRWGYQSKPQFQASEQAQQSPQTAISP